MENRQANGPTATLKELNDFITPHAKTARMMQTTASNTNLSRRAPINVHHQGKSTKRMEVKCGNCKGSHWITDCQSFRNMTPNERNEIAKVKK